MKTQSKKLRLLTLLVCVLLFGSSYAQQMTQNIRGRILDQDSKSPLIGATVLIVGSDPVKGSVTDIDGNFKITDVPVGRVTLKVSFIGYEERVIPNILLSSSKEFIMDIELEESFESLEELVITAKQDKSEVLNEMSLVSSRSFSVEETKRFAGSFNDPARLASAFAGVTNNAEGNNDIIVRGNSSKGILWRLEGIEIPNPNHFANEGSTGGPINALSSNMLSDSDFMSGAFAPEYGNALSGVFDMRLKRGNNEQREYTAGLSTLGVDFAAEGAMGNGGGSFIGNYRYSTLDLLDRAGVVDFGGVPRYQDLTYNIYLPVNKKHYISFFGLGGLSSITASEEDEDTGENIDQVEFGNTMGTTGLIHNFLINNDSYLKSFVSASIATLDGVVEQPTEENNDEFFEVFNGDYSKTYYRVGSTYGLKFNARSKIETGFIYNRIQFSVDQNSWNFEQDFLENELSDEGGTNRIQAFATWKFRITEDLTMTSGAHLNGLTLNNSYSFEPRVAMKWDFLEGKAITFGAGIHSKMETPSVYLWKFIDEDGNVSQPNENLAMTKAAHLVLGYNQKLGPNTFFKTEVYYQHLYDVPVENIPDGTYSLSNATDQYDPRVLVNEGTGRNYGVELTLEQYLHKGFYYLASASVFNSFYTPLDGIERKTAFANDYIFNFLGGKEFPIGQPEKNRELFINTKLTFMGGPRYTPIDLDASIAAGETVRTEDQPFSQKADNLFIPNISIGTRRNRPKSTHEFKIDIQNVANNQAVVEEYYVAATQSISRSYQLAMFPTISYSINF